MDTNNNLARFDFRHDCDYELDYALDAVKDSAFNHELVRRDTNETVARVANPEFCIALAAVWNARGKLQNVERYRKALEKIDRPADAGCGCDFPCRCKCDEAEAINADAMRDIAAEALAAPEVAA